MIVFKDAVSVGDALITCVTMIPISEDLNNFYLFPMYRVAAPSYRGPFEDMFGSTEEEVKELLQMLGLGQYLDEVRKMYNGYSTGTGLKLYCPFSLSQALTLPFDGKPLQAHWVRATSTGLIVPERIVSNEGCGPAIIDQIVKLCALPVDAPATVCRFPGVIFKFLEMENILNLEDSFWNYMYYAGYLTAVPTAEFQIRLLHPNVEVDYFIPNGDVRIAWVTFFHEALFGKRGTEVEGNFRKSLQKFLDGELEEMGRIFQSATSSFSFTNEPRGNNVKVLENWYHRVFAGTFSLNYTEHYSVSSCVEGGKGLPDIKFLPFPRYATKYVPITMELKSAHASTAKTYAAAVDTLRSLTEEACGQVITKAYHDDPTFASYSKLYQFGVAVCGKYAAVRYRTLRRSRKNGKWIDPIDTVFSDFSPPFALPEQVEAAAQVAQLSTSNPT